MNNHESISIVTDSGCSMLGNPEAAGVTIVPLHLSYPTLGRLKDVLASEITVENFYKTLTLENLPQTSAPNINQFMDAYTSLYPDTVLSIHMSDKISSTFGNATLASIERHYEQPKQHIETVDTKNTSIATWFIVKQAFAMANNHMPIDEILQTLDYSIKKTHLLAVFDTLEFFKRGGRAKQVGGAIFSALHINPILGFNADGKIIPVEFSRTPEKARTKMIEMVNDSGPLSQCAVIHTNAPELAQQVKNNLSNHTNVTSIPIYDAGPTLAVHGGPGVVGVCYQWNG